MMLQHDDPVLFQKFLRTFRALDRVLLLLFCVQHMTDAIHTTDQTGNNFYHVTQFHPITVNHICFRYISCHIDNKKYI
jgi:hypothetical protein